MLPFNYFYKGYLFFSHVIYACIYNHLSYSKELLCTIFCFHIHKHFTYKCKIENSLATDNFVLLMVL